MTDMTIQEAENHFIEEFNSLDNWFLQYELLLELAGSFPLPEDCEKTDATKIHGCQTETWLVMKEEDGRLQIACDSESLLIRGILSIFPMLLNGYSLEDTMDVHYLSVLGTKELSYYEDLLTEKLENVLREIEGVTVIGGNVKKHSVISVVLDGIYAYDAACLYDKYGIALRSGTHCAQPIVHKSGYSSVLRFSPAFYNTPNEIEKIHEITQNVIRFFRR